MGNLSKLVPGQSWKHMAIVLTIPVACGLGYIYYKKRCNNNITVPDTLSDGIQQDSYESDKTTTAVPADDPERKLTAVEMAENIKNAGNDFFRAQSYEEAISCYTEAIKLCPDHEKHTLATFYQNRAAAFERLGKYDLVIEDCSNALALNTRYLKAVIRRAKAAEQIENYQLAIEDLAVACVLENYQVAETMQTLDRISKLYGKQSSDQFLTKNIMKLPSKFFLKTYLSTFKYGSIVNTIDKSSEQVEQLLKKLEEANKYLLNCNAEKTELLCTELVEECDKVGNIDIKAEAMLLRGTCSTLSKQYQKAYSDLSFIIDADNINIKLKVNALIKRGTLHQHKGDTTKCMEDFHTAKEVDENNSDIYHHLGQVCLVMDKLPESVDHFRKAVALDPDFPITIVQHCYAEYKLASASNNEEDKQHFLKEFQNIIEKYPNCTECLTLYAQVLTEISQYTQAEKLFDAAIEKEPDHAALYVHKALLLLQWKADVDEAKKLIKKALRLDKDCEFAYETIGTIELQLGNFRSAVEYFDEAIIRFTSNEELLHLFTIRNTAEAQMKANERLGLFVGNGTADILN